MFPSGDEVCCVCFYLDLQIEFGCQHLVGWCFDAKRRQDTVVHSNVPGFWHIFPHMWSHDGTRTHDGAYLFFSQISVCVFFCICLTVLSFRSHLNIELSHLKVRRATNGSKSWRFGPLRPQPWRPTALRSRWHPTCRWWAVAEIGAPSLCPFPPRGDQTHT